jgi:hypothetical protein
MFERALCTTNIEGFPYRANWLGMFQQGRIAGLLIESILAYWGICFSDRLLSPAFDQSWRWIP